MNSHELFAKAVQEVESACGCSDMQARLVVHSIAAYIARSNEEMFRHEGPAWDYYVRNCASIGEINEPGT